MAVLSACLTFSGGSREPWSSGNLVEALFSAGMPDVVASRWNIDGESSQLLIARFYKENFAGRSLAEVAPRFRERE